jgi:hypothetical protein
MEEPSTDISETNCLICISPCKELSTDLFLYNCECVYVIHKECFIDWRRVSKTDRICIICHEELLGIREHRPNVIIPFRANRCTECVNYVVIPAAGVFLVIIISIILQFILTIQIQTTFYKKNINLLQYNMGHDEL